jgi:hypothetical protein
MGKNHVRTALGCPGCAGDIMSFMANGNIKFVATEVVSKPGTVKFETKSGKIVSFRAIKTFERKKVARPRAKKK